MVQLLLPASEEKASRCKNICCLELPTTAARLPTHTHSGKTQKLPLSLGAFVPLKLSCLCFYNHIQPVTHPQIHRNCESQPSFQESPFSFPQSPRETAICHQVPQLHDCQGVFWIPEELTGHPPALLAPLALEASLCRTMCCSVLFPNGYSFPTSSLLLSL